MYLGWFFWFTLYISIIGYVRETLNLASPELATIVKTISLCRLSLLSNVSMLKNKDKILVTYVNLSFMPIHS